MQNFYAVIEYTIEEYRDGWSWSAWNGQRFVDESGQYFASADDARQDAVKRAGGCIYVNNPLSTLATLLPLPNPAMRGFSASAAARGAL